MQMYNDWLFDRKTWTDMFASMSKAGFNAMVFANTHPFAYMIKYEKFTEAAIISDEELEKYQTAYHWIFAEAKRHGIEVWFLFFSVYYTEPYLDHLGVYDRDAYAAHDHAIEYTRYCVSEFLKEYPEIDALFGEASENIHGSRGTFLREAIVRPFEEHASPDTKLIIRGWCSDEKEFKDELVDKTDVPIIFSVKYTWEHFVHSDCDPLFTEWTENAGAENVIAEFWISNFEPFTSFSYSTVCGILSRLKEMGCQGFSIHPLSMYEWPYTSDKTFDYQWERDEPWYSSWGDTVCSTKEMQPFIEDYDIRSGFEAASEILKLSAVYFAGDRQNQWHPQFCSVRHSDGVRLFTIKDMCSLSEQLSPWGWEAGSYKAFHKPDWMTSFGEESVMHFEDYFEDATDAYGPQQFISDLESLVLQAEKSIKLAKEKFSGEKQLALVRHAEAQVELGNFWAMRARAGLSFVTGDHPYMLACMEKALEHFRKVEELESRNRDSFRVLTGRCAQANDWSTPRIALERELVDYKKNVTDKIYYSGKLQHRDTSTHPRGMFGWRPPKKG